MIEQGDIVALLRRLRSWNVTVYRGRRGTLHIHSELGNVSIVPDDITLGDEQVVIEGKAEGYTPVTLTFEAPADDGTVATWSEHDIPVQS